MSVMPSSPVKVILETPDGKVLEATALMASITIEEDIDDYVSAFGSSSCRYVQSQRAEISLQVIGSLEWVSRETFVEAVEERRTAKEYICSWCGTINDIDKQNCRSCGGSRGFLLE